MQDNSDVTLGTRILSLFCGAFYFAIVIRIYGHLTGTSLAFAAVTVLLATAVMIAALAICCAKWVSHEDGNRRMKLSTLFLLFVPVSIYLALYSQLLQAIRNAVPRDAEFPWWLIHIYFALFVIFTTMVLIRFGEALMWLVVVVRHKFANRRRSDS